MDKQPRTLVEQIIAPPEHPGALKRHIILDNDNKIVYIQVMKALNGNYIAKEWHDIRDGQYYKYLPADARDPIIKCVRDGYKVKPVCMEGHSNRHYYILQLNEMFESSSIIIP